MKKIKDMTINEKREYDKIRQQLHREKNKIMKSNKIEYTEDMFPKVPKWIRYAFDDYYHGYPANRYRAELDAFRNSIVKSLLE